MSEHQKCCFNIQAKTNMSSLNYILTHKLLKTKAKKQNGFTMIELMVVVAIVGVLSAVGLPQLTKAQDKAKDNAAKAEVVSAGKTCAMDYLLGTSEYNTADFPLTAGTCDTSDVSELVATSESAAETKFTVNISADGQPSNPS